MGGKNAIRFTKSNKKTNTLIYSVDYISTQQRNFALKYIAGIKLYWLLALLVSRLVQGGFVHILSESRFRYFDVNLIETGFLLPTWSFHLPFSIFSGGLSSSSSNTKSPTWTSVPDAISSPADWDDITWWGESPDWDKSNLTGSKSRVTSNELKAKIE